MAAPLEVFCCYAREDQEMLEHLKKHLMPLQRSGQITIWIDTNLNAGAEWEKELHQHLESADIILLLISPDFMTSDYCYSTEMKRALERHDQGSAVVIPSFCELRSGAMLLLQSFKYYRKMPDQLGIRSGSISMRHFIASLNGLKRSSLNSRSSTY